MVYQPHWLNLLLNRQWVTNHNDWSSTHKDNGRSSYTENCVSTTMVDHPPTKTMIYQPRWLDLLLLREWVINHNGWSSTDNYLSTTLVDPSIQSIVYQPQWVIIHLQRQWFVSHTGWTSYTDNHLLTTFLFLLAP
jgi:hypothetical protein